ncbi:MAG: hypothetical protein ABW360_12665 [Phenylobacterium sp.]
MRAETLTLILAAAGLLTACASKPREFQPNLVRTPTDAGAYQAAVTDCRAQVAERRRGGFSPAATGAGVAAGYATGAVVTAGASGSLAATAAVASVAIVAMPVVGVAAAFGVSRAIRARKEDEINDALGLCLADRGFNVSGWRKSTRAERDSAPPS